MKSNRTFTLSIDMEQIPLVVTPQALSDFQTQGLEAMDDCLIKMLDVMGPANAYPVNTYELPQRSNPLDLVGQMMLDGMANGNTRKVILCALWFTHHYPSVTGLVSNGSRFHFVTEEHRFEPLPESFACAS